MKLSYRGVKYDYEPTPVDLVESEVAGQYRGQAFKFGYLRHIPVPQPILNLTYRGVAYRTTALGSTEAIEPAVRSKAAVPAYIHPVVRSQHAVLSEVARIHRQNIQRRLQHRMEVAKAKGDTGLLNQLEREMQQFV
ncbi:DUF4278 domain-containing protein [Oculatella sp. LEGE 06141]|uniref:arginine synthesis PII-interacting regulator PirA n=1 Tax=Oculatella sp. LEGE 06141 TaxID=1828648 RepID=UPI00187E2550|nr:DUF4278 domain-containing protein [Oculatella sp. LEGE 06141]MBE9180729.1 DUF4278 domain-containing protein [Oculatella sp. LEGE 06141]